MSFDKIAFGHQTAALYGVSAPVVPPEPPAPGPNNIVNVDNLIERQEAPADRPPPRRYSAELAKMLRNVSAETWSTGSQAELGRISAQVIKHAKKSERQAVRERFERLGVRSETVQTLVSRLATYPVRDMSVALKRCSDWDMARQALEDALGQEDTDRAQEAQAALDRLVRPSDAEREKARAFETLVGKLSDLAQDLRDISEGMKLPDGLRHAIDDLVLTLDSRVSELGTLGMHLVEMAGEAEEDADAHSEILDGQRSMVDLAKGMGGVMHGNYESVAFHANEVADACEALARMLGRAEAEVVDGRDLRSLQSVFVRADRQIVSAEGRLNGELAQRMDPKVLAGLRAKISQLRVRLERCRVAAVCSARRRFVQSLPQPFVSFLADTSDETFRLCPRLKRLYDAQKRFADALMAYVMGGDAKRSALNKAIRAYADMFDDANIPALIGDLRRELDALAARDALTPEGHGLRGTVIGLQEGNASEGKQEKDLIRELFGVNAYSVREFLDACRDQVDAIGAKSGSGVFLAGDVAAAVAGKARFSDLLLASLYDVGIESIDRDLVDGPGVRERNLGAGGVNTVKKITYPPSGGSVRPREVVFKPDFTASVGNTQLCLYTDGYEGTPQALKLNLASSAVARRLGCEGRLTKTSAMFHKGQFGLGMTLAPGDDAADFETRGMGALDALLESQDPALRRKGLRIGNDILRQTVDLQWLDLLTGQGDRHGGNYKIHVDVNANPPETAVTGIDNDMCMQKYRVGLTRLQLSKARRQEVRDMLVETIRGCGVRYANQSAKRVADRMMRECFDRDGVIDFGRTPPLPPELVAVLCRVTGIKSLYVPKAMSETMFSRLQAINADDTGASRQAFVDEIASLLPPANVRAFAARLDDLLALVREGRVTVVPEATDGRPTPWLEPNVLGDIALQSRVYPLANDRLPADPDFKTVRDRANCHVTPFVSRDCGTLLLKLVSLSGVAIAN